MDNLTVEQRRKNMQNIRSTDTKVELLVAKALRKQRIYFTRNVKSMIGKPDFVFRRKKVVVFVDSDFWHGHTKRCIMPKSNWEYWIQKINRNKIRDREVNKQLKEAGWKVIRIWEHDLKKRFNYSFSKILVAINRNKLYDEKVELNADIRNKLQPAKTALERIAKGEKVSDEFILMAIQELNEVSKVLKRKQIKTIRNKLFLLLPEQTRNRLPLYLLEDRS